MPPLNSATVIANAATYSIKLWHKLKKLISFLIQNILAANAAALPKMMLMISNSRLTQNIKEDLAVIVKLTVAFSMNVLQIKKIADHRQILAPLVIASRKKFNLIN